MLHRRTTPIREAVKRVLTVSGLKPVARLPLGTATRKGFQTVLSLDHQSWSPQVQPCDLAREPKMARALDRATLKPARGP